MGGINMNELTISKELDLKQYIESLKNETDKQKEDREQRYLTYVEQNKIEIENKKRELISSVFGLKYADCTFDNYLCSSIEQEKIKQVCNDYMAMPHNRGESMMMFGRSGTGKNHLLVAMFRNRMEMLQVCRIEYLNAEKMKFQKFGQNWMEKFSIYCRCPYLVIPDLVIRKDGLSESIKELLLFIIDERYNNCKPIIICTNVNAKELKNAIDFDGTERVSDRLREMIGNRVYLLDWESHRGK